MKSTPHFSQTPLEKLVLPSWVDHDPAADEPNYLGYVMSGLPAALIGMLLLLALAVAVF